MSTNAPEWEPVKKPLPKELTEADIRELAQFMYENEINPNLESVEEYEDDLRDSWAYKITDYQTIFPTYINEVYVILNGYPRALTIRRELGKLWL